MLLGLIDMVTERGVHAWAAAVAAKDVVLPSFHLHRGSKRSFVVYVILLMFGLIVRWLCDRLLRIQFSEGRRYRGVTSSSKPLQQEVHAIVQTPEASGAFGSSPHDVRSKSPAGWVEAASPPATPQKALNSSLMFWDGVATPQQNYARRDQHSLTSPQSHLTPSGGSHHNLSEACGETSGARSSTSSHPGSPSSPHEEEDLLAASVSYNAEYRERMLRMEKPDAKECAKAFLGFSIVDDVEHHELVVDGVYRDGPAFQVGVRIEDALTHVCGHRVNTVVRARQLVALHCRAAELAALTFLRPSGESYTVKLWVMTTEKRFEGKPYHFDLTGHVKDQLPTASSSRRRSMSRFGGP